MESLDYDGQCFSSRAGGRRVVVDVVIAIVRQLLDAAEGRVAPLEPDGRGREYLGFEVDRCRRRTNRCR